MSTLTTVSPRSIPATADTLILADAILQAQVGVSVRAVRRNLRTVLQAATPAQVVAGIKWYATAQEAAEWLEERYYLPRGMGACIIAALSPRTRWSDNLRYAEWLAQTVPAWLQGEAVFTMAAGCMSANHSRALRVVSAGFVAQTMGQDVWGAMVSALGKGPKVHAFAHNMAGHMSTHVTVDVWAMRAALKPTWKRGDDMAEAEQGLNRKGVYSALSRAYMAEAKLAGITPAELQAIIWCSISNYTG